MWTLHGRENSLVGFMAIVDAMLAFAKSRGDAMRSIRCVALSIVGLFSWQLRDQLRDH